MAPHSEEPSGPWEVDYAIRELKKGMETLAAQVKENTKDIRDVEKANIQNTTKITLYCGFFSILVGAVMKFLIPH